MDGVHVLNRDQYNGLKHLLEVADRAGAELVFLRRCPRCPGVIAADARHPYGLCGYCGHGPTPMTAEAAAAAATDTPELCPVCRQQPIVARFGACPDCAKAQGLDRPLAAAENGQAQEARGAD